MAISDTGSGWSRLRAADRRQPPTRNRAVAEVIAWRSGEISRRWPEACAGSGLGHRISTPSGPTIATPTVGKVIVSDTTVLLTVRLRPGQVPSDIVAVAPRLAYAMGVGDLRVYDLGPMWVLVELLAERPGPGVSVVVPFPPVNYSTPALGQPSDEPDYPDAG